MADDEYLTPPVREYIELEAEPLRGEPAFAHLFEVGCGHGRYLVWARERGLHYDGLDIVPSFVEIGRSRLEKLDPLPLRCKLHVGSAEDLHAIWSAEGLGPHGVSTIVFFPFNCFGNVARPEHVARSIAATSARVFLSMFTDSSEATARRREYYARSGYASLEVQATDRGARFTSAEGLWSFAYNRRTIEQIFDAAGYALTRVVELGSIAAGYMFCPRDEGAPGGAP